MSAQKRGVPDVVVFGLYETGLGVARSLRAAGLRVLGVDSRKDVGWYSRDVQPVLCPHPQRDRRAFLEWVGATIEPIHGAYPAFITGDNFLYPISAAREELSAQLLLNLPSEALLAAISDKLSQAELAASVGIEVPRTVAVTGKGDLERAAAALQLPVFLKGLEVNRWRSVMGGSLKGFVVRGPDEFIRAGGALMEKAVPFIAQELVPGPESSHLKYCAYVSAAGDTLAEFTLRKIRQYPEGFGVGAIVESFSDDELVRVGRHLFAGIGYRGTGSAEFKRDERDGKLKLIELNPRYWQQNYLATACGVNFPWIQYCDMLGLPISEHRQQAVGVRWISRSLDLNVLRERQERGTLTLRGWLRERKRPRVFADFSWRDPLPGLHMYRFGRSFLKVPIVMFLSLRRRLQRAPNRS